MRTLGNAYKACIVDAASIPEDDDEEYETTDEAKVASGLSEFPGAAPNHTPPPRLRLEFILSRNTMMRSKVRLSQSN